MAHFRGTMQGNRGEVSRLGSPASGLQASVNGWGAGIRVEANVNMKGQDEFLIFMTTGSSPHGFTRHIATVTEIDSEPIITYPALV